MPLGNAAVALSDWPGAVAWRTLHRDHQGLLRGLTPTAVVGCVFLRGSNSGIFLDNIRERKDREAIISG